MHVALYNIVSYWQQMLLSGMCRILAKAQQATSTATLLVAVFALILHL